MAGINRTTGKATDLITFSRASGGTALRKISYGSELVTNGTFDTASDWLAGGGWSIGSGVASTTAAGNLNQSTFVASVRSKVVKVSYDIVSAMSGSVAPYFQQVAPTVITRYGTYRSAIGSYTDYIVVPENATVFGFNTNATAGSIDNISVKEVLFDQPDGTLTLFNHPTNIPRIEYDAAGNVKGLLIEEARTNLVTYSEDFTGAGWTVSNGTKTTGVSDPFGGTTAMTLTATSANGQVLRSIGGSAGTGTNYTGSFYIRRRTGAGVVSLFNPNGGGITATSITSEWQRYSVTGAGAAATNFIGVRLSTSGDEVDIAYAQFEAGSFPTSYIPTSGATATRAADIASISVDNFGYNQKAGTVVVEAIATTQLAGSMVNICDDGAGGSVQRMQARFSGNSIQTIFATNGAADAIVTNYSANPQLGETSIGGWSFKGPNTVVCHGNGNVSAPDTSHLVPTPSQLRVGRLGSAEYLNGHIKSIAYYPRRLSNAQLQALTA